MNEFNLREDYRVKLRPCPNCGMDVELVQKSDRLLAFVCPPESPCRGSGLFTCADADKRDSAVEAYNRRSDQLRRPLWEETPSEYDRLCGKDR